MTGKGFDLEGIRERLVKRQELIDHYKEQGKNLDKNLEQQLKQELQQEHQGVLLLEAQKEKDDRQEIVKLRSELEQQQQDLLKIKQLNYQRMAVKMAPPMTVLRNAILAFVVGGLICVIGQVMFALFQQGGLVEKEASTATSATLVFFGALFTGLGLYDELGKFAGAGSIIPITGFANSMVAPALEFKREGFVYGVGARLFTIAGPVITYGTVVSIFIGLIYYFTK
ncbi:MAG: stage sporulation protein [Peptococcaceae bacterium]|nr:stage sporulation protein [Peptococcaceae bacterium]